MSTDRMLNWVIIQSYWVKLSADIKFVRKNEYSYYTLMSKNEFIDQIQLSKA